MWVKVDSPFSNEGSAAQPNGNTERPVNNIPLAVQIANERGFTQINVIGDLTLDTGDDVRYMKIVGTSHVNSHLTVNPGCLCVETSFESFDIEGTLDGDSEIIDCIVGDLVYFNGHIHNSTLRGTIILDGTQNAKIDDCSMLNILQPPVIDCNFSNQSLIMSNYGGTLNVKNVGNTNSIGIGIAAGDVVIESSCTGGVVAVSGTGTVYDNSLNACYVIDKTLDGTEISNIKRLIELQRPHHTGTGQIWFWDPINGLDTHDGDHQNRAFKTFSRAHDAVKDNNHDTIMVVPGDDGGNTIITEKVTITKNYVFLRGPGRDVKFHYTSETVGIDILGDGVEVSGFRLENSTIGGIGVRSSGSFTFMKNLWLENSYHGIHITSDHAKIHNVNIDNGTNCNMEVFGDVTNTEIFDCTINNVSSDGIQINTSAGFGGIKLKGTNITNCDGYGITLSSTTQNFIRGDDNVIELNTNEGILDNGINNITETSSGTPGDVNISEDIYYNGSVFVDVDNGFSGTSYPVGTLLKPSNNLNNAKTIAVSYNISTIDIISDIVMDASLDGLLVRGNRKNNLDLNNQSVIETTFENINITGIHASELSTFRGCTIKQPVNLSGVLIGCHFSSSVPITLKGGVQTTLTDCRSILPIDESPSFDFTNNGITFVVRAYSGDLEIKNSTDNTNKSTIEFLAGKLNFNSDNTQGVFNIRGIIDDTNIETGGATVIQNGVASNGAILRTIRRYS